MKKLSLAVFMVLSVFGFAVPLPEHHYIFPPLISGTRFALIATMFTMNSTRLWIQQR